jgi:integrase
MSKIWPGRSARRPGWTMLLTRRRLRHPRCACGTPGQLRSFLEHVRDDRLNAAWLLAATTGMRRGEILGLRWSDLDLDAGRVAVRRPRILVDYQVQVSEPKTAKGRRSLALDPVTVAALRAHRARQAEEKLALVAAITTLIWCSPLRTGPLCIQSGFQTGSDSVCGRLGCQGSGCMMCGTATRRRH